MKMSKMNLNETKGIEVIWLSKTGLTNLNSGEGESNLIDIKKFKINDVEFPYVSGQAMRFYIRESIRRNLKNGEFMCVPDERGETCCDIEKCLNCDLFGFMSTIKGKKPGEGEAKTRISPIKVSPAIGLLSFDENSVVDFLTRRHTGGKLEGDIVNVEIGTNIYKCGLAIDIVKIGGEEKIDKSEKTVKLKYFIDENKRKERLKKVLESLRFISDYSKQARLLTDFTPDVICVTFQNKYSHRLQKLFELNNKIEIDTKRLEEILNDVKEYSNKIFFGMISGIIQNEDDVKKIFEKFSIPVITPTEVISEAIKNI